MRNSTIDAIIQSGKAPLFSAFMHISEGSFVFNGDCCRIGKFLLSNGLNELPVEVFESLTYLVYKSVSGNGVLMRDAYSDLRCCGSSCDAARTKMAYHIKKCYSSVRDLVMLKYHYDIGKSYGGNKNFIYKMSLVYNVFCKNA